MIFRFLRAFYAVKWSRTWLACQTKFIYVIRGVLALKWSTFQQKRAKIDDFTTLRKRMVTKSVIKGVLRQKIEFFIFSTFLGRIMKYNLVGMPSQVVYVFCEYIGSVLVCFWRKKSDFWWFFIAVSTHIGKKKAKSRFFDFSIFSRFLRRQMKSDMVGMPNQVYIPSKGCVSFETAPVWAKKK